MAINDGVRDSPSVSAARILVLTVKTDPVITAINRYRAARAELDKIAVREPTLPNGNPADETEEYAAWETASHKAQDVAATAWAEVTATQPTTVAGAIALINCYLEIWSEHPIRADHQPSGVLKILRSFLRSIAE
jgi:hypothetical protein